MRSIVMIALLLSCGVIQSYAQVGEGTEVNKKEAEQRWEQMIEAKGGRDRLYGITNMVVSSRSKVRLSLLKSYEHKVDTLYVFPDKYWRLDDNRPSVFGLQMDMYNYSTGMKYHEVLGSPDNILKLVPFELSEQHSIGSHLQGLVDFLMETKWWRPVVRGFTPGAIGLNNADTIHTLFDGQPFDVIVDRRTHLPVQTVAYSHDSKNQVSRKLISKLSDYVVVDGLRMPTRFSFGDEEGWESLSYKFNVAHDPSIFLSPPSFDLGPTAWEAKK